MATWDQVFREGIAPQLTLDDLAALETALESDDPRLIQEGTTHPPPLRSFEECTVEGACAIGYAGWQGRSLETVGAVENVFGKVCLETDRRMQEPTACRTFLSWFDSQPRADVREKLLWVVRSVINRRRLDIDAAIEAESLPPCAGCGSTEADCHAGCR